MVWLLFIPLSYGIAVVTPFNTRSPREISALQGAMEQWPLEDRELIKSIHDYLAGRSLLASKWMTTLVYTVPLMVATAGLAVVWRAARRQATRMTPSDVKMVTRFAWGFGLACLVMYPMFTQDFWLSVLWGRMIVDGDNPYYVAPTARALAGLPLHYEEAYMTYGPLWGWVSAAVTWVAGRREVVEFLILKVLTWAAWAGCLSVIVRMVRTRTGAEQVRAVLLIGWMPMSYFLAVGEGHNDVFMVLPMLLWLHWLIRGKHFLSPWALGASVLVKYVTLPLAAVEIWRGWVAARGRRFGYVLVLAACGAAAALCVLSLARDLDFLEATRQMQKWHMLTPAKALYHIFNGLHVPIRGGVFTVLVLAALTVLFLCHLLPLLRAYWHDRLLTAVLSGGLIVLLVVVGHVWPWFVLWVLAVAAVAPRSLAKDMAVALALPAPFVHIYWIWGHEWVDLKYATVPYYLTVAGLLIAVRIHRRRRAAADSARA